jgi:hypothetical protein
MMRALPALLSTTPLVAAALCATSFAWADGALITVKDNGSNVLVNRATLNGFNVSSTQVANIGSQSSGAGAAKVTYTPASFEIDSVAGAGALVKAAVSGTVLAVTIEFTTANAQGVEQVTSVGNFKTALMQTCGFSFDDSGFRGNYAFAYAAVSYTTPAPPAATGATGATGRKMLALAPMRELTQPLPTIHRLAVRPQILLSGAVAAAPANVDSVYFSLTGYNENTAFPRTKVKTFSGDLDVPIAIGSQSTGAGAGKITFNPFTITQAKSSPTLVFQQSVSSGTAFKTGTVSFVHTAADGSTTSQLDLNVKLVAAKSEDVSFQNGVSTEKTQFEYGGLTTTP